MYHVRQPKGLPLFEGTFAQCVKGLLSMQKKKLLNHAHYEIHGAGSKRDPVVKVCDFYADDIVEDLV